MELHRSQNKADMSKKFDKLLGEATDSTLIEPNWDAIIACFDSVRAGEVPGKQAMTSLRKRIQHDNPHVVMHALLVLDACVKNCGPKIHTEVATREFMEEFKNLGIESKYDEVKNKVLEMLQCWAMAFANKPEYKIVVDTHNLLKLAGFDFPSIKEADAMFYAQVAPDWQEGNECYRCRAVFGLLTRKHHCRSCGQIFCDKCSSRELPLPQFGIEKAVRVCDACFDKGGKPRQKQVTAKADVMAISDVSQEEKEKILREKEEEDLALALAMSKSEAEAKEQERQKSLVSMYNGDRQNISNDAASLSSYQPSEVGYKGAASASVAESPCESLSSDDPLARYLNRDYWQQRKNGTEAKVEEWASKNPGVLSSAPLPSEPALSTTGTLVDDQLGDLSLQSSDQPPELSQHTEATLKWCQELKQQVEVMDSRIRSNVARGRQVFNDTAIQGLYQRLTDMHHQVLARMGKLDEERAYYEGLQDHVAHITDARSAVNELREESERRKIERLAEEQRIRQSQMKQTLDLMRMKKHTMLMEQRDVALLRFQQQEQEMQARRQQAQQYYPYGYGAQQQAGYQGYAGNYSQPQVNQYAVPQQQHQHMYNGQQHPPMYQPDMNGTSQPQHIPASGHQQQTYTPVVAQQHQPVVSGAIIASANHPPQQQYQHQPAASMSHQPVVQQQQYYQQYQQTSQYQVLPGAVQNPMTSAATMGVVPQPAVPQQQHYNHHPGSSEVMKEEVNVPDAPLISFD